MYLQIEKKTRINIIRRQLTTMSFIKRGEKPVIVVHIIVLCFGLHHPPPHIRELIPLILIIERFLVACSDILSDVVPAQLVDSLGKYFPARVHQS
jgi:hypothetical protein